MDTMTHGLRPGSYGAKAVAFLTNRGREASEVELCAAIELDDDARQMLAFPVKLGMLVCDERDGVRYWRLGEGKPVQPPAPKLPEPAPQPDIDVPVLVKATGERIWPGGYRVTTDSIVGRMLAYLEQHAPAGSGKWLLSRSLAHAVDTDVAGVPSLLSRALERGTVQRDKQNNYIVWQMGRGKAQPAEKAAEPPPAPSRAIEPLENTVFLKAHLLEPYSIERQEAPRRFRCGIFSDGKVSIVKGSAEVDLNADEALVLFEHLSAARHLGGATK